MNSEKQRLALRTNNPKNKPMLTIAIILTLRKLYSISKNQPGPFTLSPNADLLFPLVSEKYSNKPI